MKKRKVKFLCATTLGLVVTAGIALLIPSIKSFAGVANGDCAWNHYAKVDATSYENGCNEYWVCCQHHEVVFEEPSEGTIKDETHEEGFLKTLTPSDKRFIAAKTNVVSDASSVEYAWHDYPLVTGTFTPKTDAQIGAYVECSNLTNTNDAVWITPKNLPNENLFKTFTKVYFWVRSTNDQPFEIRYLDYGCIEGKSVVANQWTYVEVEVNNILAHGNGFGISHWKPHSDPINFDISSFYGIREGVVQLMDVSNDAFKGVNSSTTDRTYPYSANEGGNAEYAVDQVDTTSMVSPYAKATNINRTGDQINISASVKADISMYSVVFFYVRWNAGTISGDPFCLRTGIYNNVYNLNQKQGEWTLVVITPSKTGQLNDLQYYGVGCWGTWTDVELDFSSIFAYNAAEYDALYNAATDYWVKYDAAVEGESTVNHKDSFIKPYSRITGITRKNGQEKFRPDGNVSIADYDAIFFWVRSNVELTYMKVLNSADAYDESKQIFCIDLMPANTWCQVYIPMNKITDRNMNKVVFGKYGTFENVTLDFSTVYGIVEE